MKRHRADRYSNNMSPSQIHSARVRMHPHTSGEGGLSSRFGNIPTGPAGTAHHLTYMHHPSSFLRYPNKCQYQVLCGPIKVSSKIPAPLETKAFHCSLYIIHIKNKKYILRSSPDVYKFNINHSLGKTHIKFPAATSATLLSACVAKVTLTPLKC